MNDSQYFFVFLKVSVPEIIFVAFFCLFICSVSGLYGLREIPEIETAGVVLLSRVQGEKVESSLIS